MDQKKTEKLIAALSIAQFSVHNILYSQESNKENLCVDRDSEDLS